MTAPNAAAMMAPESRRTMGAVVGRDAIEAIYRQTIQAFNERDWETYARHWAPDVHYWSPAFESDDRDEVIGRFRAVAAAVPDLTLESVAFCYDERANLFIGEHVESGTMTAEFVTPFGTLPPTGKPFYARNTMVVQLDDRSIGVDVREYFDVQTFLRQMGLG